MSTRWLHAWKRNGRLVTARCVVALEGQSCLALAACRQLLVMQLAAWGQLTTDADTILALLRQHVLTESLAVHIERFREAHPSKSPWKRAAELLLEARTFTQVSLRTTNGLSLTASQVAETVRGELDERLEGHVAVITKRSPQRILTGARTFSSLTASDRQFTAGHCSREAW